MKQILAPVCVFCVTFSFYATVAAVTNSHLNVAGAVLAAALTATSYAIASGIRR